jgi:hypothetical protein
MAVRRIFPPAIRAARSIDAVAFVPPRRPDCPSGHRATPLFTGHIVDLVTAVLAATPSDATARLLASRK